MVGKEEISIGKLRQEKFHGGGTLKIVRSFGVIGTWSRLSHTIYYMSSACVYSAAGIGQIVLMHYFIYAHNNPFR
jgi:hypothetical protein